MAPGGAQPNMMPPAVGGTAQPYGTAGVQPPAAQGQPGARGINPDAVPSPIVVNAADQEKYVGVPYTTSSKLCPPMVWSKADIIDDGNASPRVMRANLYQVPQTMELLKTCAVPLSLVIRPLADPTGVGTPVPVVDHGPDGPIRCSRCKAYMNPGFRFVDGGRRFSCNFCGFTCAVPDHYFANLDHTGRRHDIMSRPELLFGTVEYKATSVYCRKGRTPRPISYLFVIDVSYNAIKNGLVAAAAQSIQQHLDLFPADSRMGIITFDKDVHFYNLTAGLGSPQMMVVTDVNEPFVPLKDGLLVPVVDSREVIENLLSQLPHMFEHTRSTEPVLGSAVISSVLAMKDFGGKMVLFSSTMPTKGPGAIRAREETSLLGTEKEKSLFTPQSEFYKEQAEKCVECGISADIFICNQAYFDVATIGMLAHYTGGTVFPIRNFHAHTNGPQLISHVRRILTRKHGYDAMMRVRASTGLRPVDFCGSFTMTNTTDMELAGVDEDKAVVIECKHDAKIDEANDACFQVALLYTTPGGQRVIRVHTLSLRVCTQVADAFRAADMENVVTSLVKRAIRDHRRFALVDLQTRLTKESVAILGAYRKHCTSPNTAQGQLILPENLKLLPCFMSAVMKNEAFKCGANIGSDERMASILYLISVPVEVATPFIYPRLIQVDDVMPGDTGIPTPIRPSYPRLKEHSAYLVENGRQMLLWVGARVSVDFVQHVLGAPAFQSIDSKQTKLPELDNELSARVRGIVDEIQQQRNVVFPLVIVKQKDPTEGYFANLLVEDKSNAAASYVDYLCQLHRDIQLSLQ